MLEVGTKGNLASILTVAAGVDSTTLTETGLSIYLQANSRYYIRMGGVIDGAGDLIRLRLNYTGTFTTGSQLFRAWYGGTHEVFSANATYNTGSSYGQPQIWGVVSTATGGILSFQMCKQVNISPGDDLLLSNGSHLIATRI